MTTTARASTHIVSLVIIAAAVVVLHGPAQASCALPPQPSPYSFTGTVVSVDDDGRVAHVRTDAGRRVVVLGAGDPGSDARTSVDRRFAVGGRYEFHPVNSRSPFQDNACTATRQLSGPEADAADGEHDRLPGWLPVDEDAGPVGYAVLGAIALAPVLVAAAVVARIRRHPSP